MAAVRLCLVLSAVVVSVLANGPPRDGDYRRPPMSSGRGRSEEQDGYKPLKWEFQEPEEGNPPSEFGGFGEKDKNVSAALVFTNISPRVIRGIRGMQLAFEESVRVLRLGDAVSAVTVLREGLNSQSDFMEELSKDVHALAKRAIKHNREICERFFSWGIEFSIKQCVKDYIEGVGEFLKEQFSNAGGRKCDSLKQYIELVKERADGEMPELTTGLVDAATRSFGLDLECIVDNLDIIGKFLETPTTPGTPTPHATDVLLAYATILKHLNMGAKKRMHVANAIVCHTRYIRREVAMCPKMGDRPEGMRPPGGDEPTEEGEDEASAPEEEGSAPAEGETKRHLRRGKSSGKSPKSGKGPKSPKSKGSLPVDGEEPAEPAEPTDTELTLL